MIDFIVIGILVLILAGAGRYVYIAKKNGNKCIGCPDGCSCQYREFKRKDVHRGCCGAPHKN